MIKVLITIITAGILGGCAATYTLDGQKYKNSTEFQSAVDAQRNTALTSIKPLPKPLTPKKLIAAIPSEQSLYTENIRRVTAANGSPPNGISLEIIENLTKSNYKLIKIFYEGTAQRNIYTSVEIRNMPSMITSLEPSKEYDVIYYTEPSVGSGQYFYASIKHGKQIFSFDRSQTGPDGKIKAFVEAIQALAIRE